MLGCEKMQPNLPLLRVSRGYLPLSKREFWIMKHKLLKISNKKRMRRLGCVFLQPNNELQFVPMRVDNFFSRAIRRKAAPYSQSVRVGLRKDATQPTTAPCFTEISVIKLSSDSTYGRQVR